MSNFPHEDAGESIYPERRDELISRSDSKRVFDVHFEGNPQRHIPALPNKITVYRLADGRYLYIEGLEGTTQRAKAFPSRDYATQKVQHKIFEMKGDVGQIYLDFYDDLGAIVKVNDLGVSLP